MAQTNSGLDSNIHKDFKKVFYKKEGRELRSKGNSNLWILIAILWITFTAIGFAAGSLEYLGTKMDDTYINWINVTIPFGDSEAGDRIRNALSTDTLAQKEYHYKNVSAYYRYPLAFKSLKKGGTVESMGRSIDINDPILNDIFLTENKIYGRPFSSSEDIGIIVTTEFLEKYGYEKSTPVVLMAVNLDEINSEYVPIAVVAVLKELPGLTIFATTPYFRNLKKEAARGNPFRRDWTTDLIYFIPGDSAKVYQVEETIDAFFANHNEYDALSPWVELTTNHQSYQTGFNVNISFLGELEYASLDTISEVILNSEELTAHNEDLIRFFDFKTYQVYKSYNYDHLAINFKRLSKVRAFKEYFYKTHELNIDVAQIEAKENYSYVSNLTLIISIILITFSLLIISMFISNILNRHLEKIRKNIGTFKAFGLNINTLLVIYINLIFRFVMVSLIVAFLTSLVFGEIGGIRFALSLVQDIEKGETYFNLLSEWSLISVLLIIIVSLAVTYFTSIRIVKRTPGDLIYDRL